jgi:hypothetical protein
MDVNSNAFRIVSSLTAENKGDRKKTEASRAGGIAGGAARAAKLSPQRRKDIAIKANAARWSKKNEPEIPR